MSIPLYHGSNTVVEFPEVRRTKYTKDFSWGFYCTNNYDQARKWANRNPHGVVNFYTYTPDPALRVLKFDGMSDEWLDFIGRCRAGVPRCCRSGRGSEKPRCGCSPGVCWSASFPSGFMRVCSGRSA